MAMVDKQTRHLERMINDLLDTARIEAGHLDLRCEHCDGAQLVKDTLELFRPSGAKLVPVLPKEPVTLWADPVRMTQVLNNLVSNAIKYSPEGGRIEVRLERRRREVVFIVSDQGPGIAPDEAAHIFEPFRRAKLIKEGVPGAGLGLSVARRIVEAHGGQILLESEVGRGAKFRIRLPIAHTRKCG
jgi:signal transduction histidine kinase